MLACRFLFFGDVVGQPGRRFLQNRLPELKKQYQPDFVFANGENAAGGFGLNASIAKKLQAMGIDGLTLGNHTWDQRDFWNEIGALEFVCRPLNLPVECPGKTSIVFDFKGQRLALLNLLGRAYSRTSLDCPFKTCQSVIEQLKNEGIENFVIDIHAEATAEKYTLGWFLAGIPGVSCVVGTHTHIPTADERILSGTTAFVCDLGMCGSYNSILGFKKDNIIEKVIHGKPCRFEIGDGPTVINGVFVELDLETHVATHIERVHVLEGI